MIQESEPIQTFVNLGLTFLQAKVYVTLLMIGKEGANVREISRVSKIARQDVYRILPTLEKAGLVEKIVAMPTLYKPVSLDLGLSKLMQKRTNEFQEVQKEAMLTLKTFKLGQQQLEQEDNQFILTSERKLFFTRAKKSIAETVESIDIIYTDERMRIIAFHTVDQLQQAMARGVTIRALTDKPDTNALDKNIIALSKNPLFKLKYLDTDVPVGLAIFDNKELNICTSDKIVPSLWTNNRNVVKLARIYFDCM